MTIFNMKFVFLPLISIVLITGCSSKWEPKGVPDYTLQEAKLICDLDANTRYPIRKEVLQHTVYRDVEKNLP
ncbi:lipoprotein [Proteus mirabilis]|uniref:Lipoprotein n=1 Tax=Proteus mirabilis TaxID=584 RepID=A0A379FEU6_PROMI|nr:lipoprotein [Proteus mirabilis]